VGSEGRVSAEDRWGRFPARLQDPKVQTAGVEHWDRVVRFGAEEVEVALAA